MSSSSGGEVSKARDLFSLDRVLRARSKIRTYQLPVWIIYICFLAWLMPEGLSIISNSLDKFIDEPSLENIKAVPATAFILVAFSILLFLLLRVWAPRAHSIEISDLWLVLNSWGTTTNIGLNEVKSVERIGWGVGYHGYFPGILLKLGRVQNVNETFFGKSKFDEIFIQDIYDVNIDVLMSEIEKRRRNAGYLEEILRY